MQPFKLLLALQLLALPAFSQNVAINADGSAPDASAALDVKSTSRGLLLPRMNLQQRDLISFPATGLVIYQTDNTPGLYYNVGGPGSPSWVRLNTQWGNSGNNIYFGSGNVAIGTNFTTPTGLLHIKGPEWDIRPVILEQTATGSVGPSLRFIGTNRTYDIIGSTGSGAATGAGNFGIWDHTNNAYRFVINSSGTVGIGTATPQIGTQLDVLSSSPYTGYFSNTASGGYGIFTESDNTAGSGYGLRTVGGYMGTYSDANAPGYSGIIYGAYAYAHGTGGSGTRYGIYGYATQGTTNYGGYFNGNVNVTGVLSKGSGTFRIDHPQDPANKYLVHSFVESPDMMNIYNGNITTDASGMAEVQLPAYFEAENIDFRYQLTCIGQFAQAIVKEEIKGNRFIVQTDKPNVKVSWMVTGVRNDRFAQKHRVVPEEEKPAADRGRYLHPELYGLPAEEGINPPPTAPAVPKRAAATKTQRP